MCEGIITPNSGEKLLQLLFQKLRQILLHIFSQLFSGSGDHLEAAKTLFPADNVGRYGSLGYLRRQP
jgi:hypothetical protein